MEPMTRRFVTNVENFALVEGIDLIVFEKGQRKEEIAQARLAKFPADEGVLFIGKAQEKAKVVRKHGRVVRTGLAAAHEPAPSAVRAALEALDHAIDRLGESRLAA